VLSCAPRAKRLAAAAACAWCSASSSARLGGELGRSKEVEHIVVPEVPAERLLASARTACFAPAAAPGSFPAEALCLRAATLLRADEAGWYRWHMAVVCAATQGRYYAMLDAMSQVGVERIVIEDLVKFGEDQGLLKGRLEGEAKLLLRLLTLRFQSVPDGVVARVRSASEADLERWGDRVLTATSLDDVFAD
jgi:uncharacterized protein DUF4351